jgi:glutamyl-tRNA synthetase/glutamyl-Q tRNA(Asp) synthetase
VIHRTRFAPAPTGWLHLGHVANAIFVWGLARKYGAKVLLRIEDHDRQRTRPEYESGLLDDLDWLGFMPDVYPTEAFRHGPCAGRQRDREGLYSQRAGELIALGVVYGCSCSRQVMRAGVESSEESGCPGGCRRQQLAPAEGLVWRVQLGDGAEEFDDLLLGRQRQSLDVTDPVIRDRLGNWTYQFAVTVDDFDQGIDLVVRGLDLVTSTALQVRLARLYGRERPATFGHHALIMKSAGQKLSKSDGDTGIRGLRAAGLSSAEVIGRAAHAVGLLGEPQPIPADEVASIIL